MRSANEIALVDDCITSRRGGVNRDIGYIHTIYTLYTHYRVEIKVDYTEPTCIGERRMHAAESKYALINGV